MNMVSRRPLANPTRKLSLSKWGTFHSSAIAPGRASKAIKSACLSFILKRKNSSPKKRKKSFSIANLSFLYVSKSHKLHTKTEEHNETELKETVFNKTENMKL